MLKIITVVVAAANWLALSGASAAVPTDLIEGVTETSPGTGKSGEFVELIPDQLWAWITEEQARVVEEYRSKYRGMNLRVYMFMNDHELGSPEIKAEIMHVSLIGSKGEILASM